MWANGGEAQALEAGAGVGGEGEEEEGGGGVGDGAEPRPRLHPLLRQLAPRRPVRQEGLEGELH